LIVSPSNVLTEQLGKRQGPLARPLAHLQQCSNFLGCENFHDQILTNRKCLHVENFTGTFTGTVFPVVNGISYLHFGDCGAIRQ